MIFRSSKKSGGRGHRPVSPVDRQTDRPTDKWMDGWMDGWIGR